MSGVSFPRTPATTTLEAAPGSVSQLRECTAVLPFEHCEIMELPAGSTFAEAAQTIRVALGCEQA